MSTSPQEELLNQIRAGWRVIALETCEEDRALAVLERVARACEKTCMPWSLASGMAKHPESAGSLDAGLRAMASVEAPRAQPRSYNVLPGVA